MIYETWSYVATQVDVMKSLTVLDPQSPEARAIFHLAIVTGIIFAVIFVVVAGMIVYALMRYRWREGEADPDSTRETRRWRSSGH